MATSYELDRVGDVGDPVAGSGHPDPLKKALPGYVDEPSGLRADRAAGKGAAAIAVGAVQIGAHIHTDDIPLQQLPMEMQADPG